MQFEHLLAGKEDRLIHIQKGAVVTPALLSQLAEELVVDLENLGGRLLEGCIVHVANTGRFDLGRRRRRLHRLLGGVGGGGFLDLVWLLAHGGRKRRHLPGVNRVKRKAPPVGGAWRV